MNIVYDYALQFLPTIPILGVFYWAMQKGVERQIAKSIEKIRFGYGRQLQNEKSRLDLYDRRFSIFESIFDFYNAMISWEGSPNQKEAQTRFFRARHEAAFLFSKESGIEKLLEELNTKGNQVIGYKENYHHYNDDPKLAMEQFKKTQNIMIKDFDTGLATLRVAIFPYLDFSKI